MTEMFEASGDAVEVWFRIEKDEDGYPKSQDWEQLWCDRTENGFRIDNIPFFVKGIAVGDIISTRETENATYEFDRVLARGGHDTYRIWLSEEMKDCADLVMKELENSGCQAEITLGRMIAVDVPPDKIITVRDRLWKGQEEKEWGLQIGHSRDDSMMEEDNLL
jgi:hypothetical protein